MKNKITISAFKLASLFLFAIILGVTACTEDPEESLYRDDLIGPDLPAPVIESVNPPNAALAGVTEVTITGQNFSPNAEYNLVFFDSELGDIISSTGNEIVVKAPTYADTSIDLKVAVRKVEDFSNIYNYRLEPAVEEYSFATIADYFNIVIDRNGELYVTEKGRNLYRIIFPNQVELYSPSGVSGTLPDMKFGPENQIFQLQNAGSGATAIFMVPDGGGSRVRLSAAGIRNSTSLDFDQQSNLWIGSEDNKIYKVTYPAAEVTEFEFGYSVNWLKIFEGFLYVAGSNDTEEGIWRFPLNSGLLGTAEKYFDFSENFPDTDIESFVISEDGNIYLATSNDEIQVVYPDKSFEVLYPNLLVTPISSSLVWGSGSSFYYIHKVDTEFSLIRVDVEKAGAPYIGRNL